MWDISEGLVRVANRKMGEDICLASDACKLPFPDSSFNAISSAGSAVNHIPNYPRFFEEAGRVLKPGGHLFFESDNKWKPDILWGMASALAGDPLGYHETASEVIDHVKRPFHEGYLYVFPLTYDDSKVKLLRLRAFTFHELQRELEGVGCKVIEVGALPDERHPQRGHAQRPPGTIHQGLILNAEISGVHGS